MDYSQSHPDFAAGQEAPPPDANQIGIKSSDTYDGSAPIYQWDDEYGDVGPKIEQLELELFGDPATRHERTGLDFRRFVQRIPSTSPANILKHREHRGQTGRPCQDQSHQLLQGCRFTSRHVGEYQAGRLRPSNPHSEVHHPCHCARAGCDWHCSNWYVVVHVWPQICLVLTG